MEQDHRSPHRYFDHIEEFKDKVLLDVGAAEGILSLMAIEQVKHVYLFECSEDWIDALNKTFEPWKDKVTIIKKFVSDKDDENNVVKSSVIAQRPHASQKLGNILLLDSRNLLIGTVIVHFSIPPFIFWAYSLWRFR